jgi:hypothetical protein
MQKLIGATGVLLAAILTTTETARAENPPPVTRETLSAAWKRSLLPLVASQSIDAASSYGFREQNPLLADPDGSFGIKAAGVKFGVTGALIAVEYVLLKKFPKTGKFFAIVNWSGAGVTTGLAIHNYAVR